MKKKFLVFVLILAFVCEAAIGQNKAGLNKIGGYVGWPIGLSYSHNFTKKDQLDLVAAFLIPYSMWMGLLADLGYLRSVFEPVVGGVECPLEVGGGVGFMPMWFNNEHASSFAFSLTFFADLRWEVFFANVPKFNLFIDFAPGVGLMFQKESNPVAYFSYRVGLGLRAAL